MRIAVYSLLAFWLAASLVTGRSTRKQRSTFQQDPLWLLTSQSPQRLDTYQFTTSPFANWFTSDTFGQNNNYGSRNANQWRTSGSNTRATGGSKPTAITRRRSNTKSDPWPDNNGRANTQWAQTQGRKKKPERNTKYASNTRVTPANRVNSGRANTDPWPNNNNGRVNNDPWPNNNNERTNNDPWPNNNNGRTNNDPWPNNNNGRANNDKQKELVAEDFSFYSTHYSLDDAKEPTRSVDEYLLSVDCEDVTNDGQNINLQDTPSNIYCWHTDSFLNGGLARHTNCIQLDAYLIGRFIVELNPRKKKRGIVSTSSVRK
ncbi:hypothetical protein LOTGIDRAFT_165543 [Lottia gigantea]|uniref:Uncharacterized protein n=1 Tax=Lottia gigantea TaxID=225164 RepID=V4BII1_LOTGI|nr:hypothetical protein LOTGIDRAFT_165543 [Lottia gigantea]ESO88419.1 hypothetical protein LOTGIDRAFT_165543 [Lottia gigantea]